MSVYSLAFNSSAQKENKMITAFLNLLGCDDLANLNRVFGCCSHQIYIIFAFVHLNREKKNTKNVDRQYPIFIAKSYLIFRFSKMTQKFIFKHIHPLACTSRDTNNFAGNQYIEWINFWYRSYKIWKSDSMAMPYLCSATLSRWKTIHIYLYFDELMQWSF